jgi:bifunctional non-homologous end joining protein LigD
VPDRLSEYRRRRDPRRTPEPYPAGEPDPTGSDDVFVVQEHHAGQLHWDVRLARDGVLVSWAVPRGLPADPGARRLAVHTEDHPLEYATFEGRIPAGEYGAGRTTIWDRGRYETLHWNDHRIEVVLDGRRARGRYAFVNQHESDSDLWRVERLDPAEPGRVALPDFVSPVPLRPGPMPPVDEDGEWAYEFHWAGCRVGIRVLGGRITVLDESGMDIHSSFPELRPLGEQLGSTEAYLDGEIVVFDRGRPDAEALRERSGVTRKADAKRLVPRWPAAFFGYDLVHLDGRSCVELPYAERRERLRGLRLAGSNWRVPDCYPGDGGAVLKASRANGLPGVVAKRLDGRYGPEAGWRLVTGVDVREVVIGGLHPGGLLLGVPVDGGLRYAGSASTNDSVRGLGRLVRKTSPFVESPEVEGARWVTPRLVGEVVFEGVTPAGLLTRASWRGLRPDLAPGDVG